MIYSVNAGSIPSGPGERAANTKTSRTAVFGSGISRAAWS